MNPRVQSGLFVWALCVTAFILMGVTIPNTFIAGNIISSAEVNANFAALDTAVDALETWQAGLATAQGQPRAYVYVQGNTGDIQSQWMSTGGTITVTRTNTGRYTITFPGEPVLFYEDPVQVTCAQTARFARTGSSNRAASTDAAKLGTTYADSDFWVILFNDHNP